METTPLVEELNYILGRNVRKGMHKQPAASNGRVVAVGYSLESGYSRSKFEREYVGSNRGLPRDRTICIVRKKRWILG